MAGVGICSCVSYTECQGLACVLVCLTLSVKGWIVFFYDLRWMPRVGVRSCVPYTECQGLVNVLV